jgi:hypothetical protein
LIEPTERLAEDAGDDFAVKFSLAQDRVAYDSLDFVDVDAPALRRERSRRDLSVLVKPLSLIAAQLMSASLRKRPKC